MGEGIELPDLERNQKAENIEDRDMAGNRGALDSYVVGEASTQMDENRGERHIADNRGVLDSSVVGAPETEEDRAEHQNCQMISTEEGGT